MPNEMNTDLERPLSPPLADTPSWRGHLEGDAAVLAGLAEHAQALLRRLPERSRRDPAERAQAAQIHHACRAAREGFLRRHVHAVYRSLTATLSGHCALADLAEVAARLFPGLVPTAAQLAEERRHLQRDKEGLEIDQGVFFGALLREPDIGLDLMTRMLQPTARALALLADYRRERRLDLGKLTIEAQGPSARLTVHNPACLNAEDDELIDQMETAVDLALLDETCVVALLRGGEMTHPRYRGRRVFSAGINLKELHRGQISFANFLLRRELGTLNKMAHGLRLGDATDTRSMQTLTKPWVAAVDAFAIGGGAQILLVCDHVIAATDSFFALPAAQEGIVPGVANLRLPRLAGGRLARQVILSGRRLWASDPQSAGVFDEVVEPPAMDAAIASRLEQFAAPAVGANRRMIGLCEEPLDTLRAYMAQFAIEQAQRLYSPDVLDKVKPA
jgi:(3,5-dihydroxyphenyl)acetyl-CoA 1,2-dioxygenase